MNIHEQNIAFVKTKLIDELFSMVKIKGDFIKKNEKYIPTKEMDKLTELVILSSETLEHLVNRMIFVKKEIDKDIEENQKNDTDSGK